MSPTYLRGAGAGTPQVTPQVAPQVGAPQNHRIWAIKGQDKGQDRGQDRTGSASKTYQGLLIACAEGPQAAAELRQAIGQDRRTGYFRRVLQDLISSGFIERTIPDKPTSRNQRYRLTDQGRAWLAAHGERENPS